MGSPTRPADAAEVVDLVRQAAGQGRRLALRAGDTKADHGRAVVGADPVDLTRLAGVVTYEPEELILIARPATPLSQLEALLAEHGQHLAFEPPAVGAAATLGGVLGCGASGPRRFRAGAARDFVLGVELIDGQGRRVRAGGRVVKNVTGFDLWRAVVGAHGTLGVLTEVCLKLWPRPQTERTVAVDGVARAAALEAMLAWARRPEEITGLAYAGADRRLLARVEGSDGAIGPQVEALARDAGALGPCQVLDREASAALWVDLREARPYRPQPGEALWRLALPPPRADEAVAALEPLGLGRCGLDWGGGRVWALLPAAVAAEVHDVALRLRGTAARLATGPLDPNPSAFSPLSPGLARLNRSLKQAFDPAGLFSPGRMYPEVG